MEGSPFDGADVRIKAPVLLPRTIPFSDLARLFGERCQVFRHEFLRKSRRHLHLLQTRFEPREELVHQLGRPAPADARVGTRPVVELIPTSE